MLKPLDNRVLVNPDSQEQTTKEGIVLPEIFKEKPWTGVVEAIGPLCASVKVGDRVYCPPWCGFPAPDDRKLFVESEILATMTD